MTTTESTLITPSTPGLDDVAAPEPTPRPRRRRRTALAVVGVAIALVAALLAGASTGGGRATAEAATEEAEGDGTHASTNEPGIETSSTVIERADEAAPAIADADADAASGPNSVGGADDGVDAPQPGTDPADLDSSTASLAFGQHTAKKSFTIENSGGEAMEWAADESKPWMSVSPVEGALAPGATQLIEVTVQRAGMPSGTAFEGDLTIASDGGAAAVHVSGSTPFDMVQPVPAEVVSVGHMPVICSVNSPGGPKTTPIVAKVSGPGIEGATLYWSHGGGFPSAIQMVKSGPDTWMVPAFGNLPQGVVKIAVFVENQFGDDLVERQIVINHCP